MNYENEVIEFLSKKENFGLALEVAERLDAVKAKLQKAFWHACYDKLCQTLEKDTVLAGKWKASIDKDEDLITNYHGVHLVPKDRDKDLHDGLCVVYSLVRNDYGKLLFYWRAALRSLDGKDNEWRQHESSDIQAFANDLKPKSYRQSTLDIGWRPIRTWESANLFLVELVESSDDVAENGVEVFWTLFKDTVKLAEEANAALRRGE